MPLYLVRWPNLDLALVKARNEDELIDILDEVDDPSCATWTEYRGPLYIGLKSPVTVNTSGPGEDGSPLGERKVEVEGIAEALETYWQFQLEPSDGDTAAEMHHRLVKQALPHIERAIWESEPTEDALRTAVMKELEPLLAYHWRSAVFEHQNPVYPEEARAALEKVMAMIQPLPPPEPEPKPPAPKGRVIPLAGARDKTRGGPTKRGEKEER